VLDGRLDEAPAARAELERAVRRGGASTEVYLCGPPPMMEHARRVVLELGVPEALVRQERFGSPRAHALTGGPPRTLRVGGRALEVLGGETLLEASSRAGVPLDSSCTMGGCGACRMRLVAGEVELEEPNCLSDDERRQGLVLTCVARPKSDVTLAPVAAG
jgi:ferredoxin